jgi:class 3 adenylate cyclase/tetratricopeptide (TPR) repeat protein
VNVCPACGKENPEGFQFCGFCTVPLSASSSARRELRKTVTVVFCDVVGSTALGESVDPEALRALLARYFERMKAIVERHGGTVDKFIGDAVMAVFGIPATHEDDALRACRAAVEMRDALPELGISGRIGVNTGEVVTGTAERLVTGDAVNLAARFEQSAGPGEVLIGEATHALARGTVVAEPVGPLTLKGKSEPVSAYRLFSVLDAPERRHTSRFVGREQELAQIAQGWQRARAEASCALVTVVGDAGVGKSRLVAEALAAIEARLVRGRCLPYGEGITYWPVVEVIKQLGALPSDEAAANAVRSLLRESDRPTSADEIAWAFRKLIEEQAPLVVCFDDLQWGEQTFLDLVESTGLLAAGAPLLLLCMARPELLERRPSWPAPLRLEPLRPDEANALIGPSLPDDMRRRIAGAAGGNPLFITEMLTLAMDGDELEVPPTLRALLAARLDRLEESERRVLERGAVEGEVFHRGAVQALVPEELEVLPRLAALVRHELIRTDRPQFPGEDGFRFRHLLIRDAAYEALPKAVRADLHRRFADWLVNKQALVELDELVGYHLEQAARYHAELGQPDPALALRAGDRLVAAGQRALDREDVRAAAGLFERALGLTRPFRLDVHAELDLAAALFQQPARAARVADDAAKRARQAGDETAESLARAMALHYGLIVVPGSPDELETLLVDARRRLEASGDHAGLVHVWGALGFSVANPRGRYDDWAAASERARHHSRLDGRAGGPEFGIPLIVGSRPADEALEVIDRLLEERPSAWLRLSRAWLLGMLDQGDEARQIAEDADTLLREQSGALWGEWILAELATLAGDHEDASNRLRVLCEWLEAMEQVSLLPGYQAARGRSLCLLGRFDEAEQLAMRTRAAEEADGVTDPYNPWQRVLARVHAQRGELAEAERLAREGLATIEQTDSLDGQAFALWDLADVLATAGRTEDAAAALDQALDLCRRKKNLALAKQVRDRLAQLRGDSHVADNMPEYTPFANGP